jgi:hypothetical protein
MAQVYIPAVLRRLVVERASGCCEYCGLSEAMAFAPHELDHIIAQKAWRADRNRQFSPLLRFV